MIDWINAHPLLGLIAVAWSLAWKGVALWRSAQREQKWWFVAILILNTLGILEIVYLYVVSRKYKVEVVQN